MGRTIQVWLEHPQKWHRNEGPLLVAREVEQVQGQVEDLTAHAAEAHEQALTIIEPHNRAPAVCGLCRQSRTPCSSVCCALKNTDDTKHINLIAEVGRLRCVYRVLVGIEVIVLPFKERKLKRIWKAVGKLKLILPNVVTLRRSLMPTIMRCAANSLGGPGMKRQPAVLCPYQSKNADTHFRVQEGMPPCEWSPPRPSWHTSGTSG